MSTKLFDLENFQSHSNASASLKGGVSKKIFITIILNHIWLLL